MKYVGVDQSLTHAGVCIVSTNVAPQFVTVEPKDLRDAPRLIFLRDTIAELVVDTDLLAMEGYAYDKPLQAHQLGEIGGILRVLFYEMRIPIVIVSPVQLKKFATDNIRADKIAMQAEAEKQLGHTLRDDHQADAYFLAKIALNLATPKLHTRHELEVIHALKNPVKKVTKKVRKIVPQAM